MRGAGGKAFEFPAPCIPHPQSFFFVLFVSSWFNLLDVFVAVHMLFRLFLCEKKVETMGPTGR
jgi:hypothetical protein